tara:strand:- start:586 stop:942 length:357 start_codon:yes stop_codon:yes gene_type:complete
MTIQEIKQLLEKYEDDLVTKYNPIKPDLANGVSKSPSLRNPIDESKHRSKTIAHEATIWTLKLILGETKEKPWWQYNLPYKNGKSILIWQEVKSSTSNGLKRGKLKKNKRTKKKESKC